MAIGDTVNIHMLSGVVLRGEIAALNDDGVASDVRITPDPNAMQNHLVAIHQDILAVRMLVTSLLIVIAVTAFVQLVGRDN